ncbi:DUF973 family protein [Stygiolobus caldivivus]|nr:DUF973 family protein [Stygiolobus caldivivus]
MSYQEYSGLRKLRLASLFASISMLLVYVSILLGYTTLLNLITLIISFGFSGASAIALLLLVIAGVLPFIGVGIGLFSTFEMLFGFNDLSSNMEEARTGRWGVIFFLVGVILFAIYPIGVILLYVHVGAGLGIAIGGIVTGSVIIILGIILIGIGYHRVGIKYNENTVNVGGIITTILPFVGFIITYVGLGYLLRKPPFNQYQPYQYQPLIPPQQQPQARQPSSPLPIYQTGPVAVIKPDGTVSFTVFSYQPAQLVSATIEGTNYSTGSISPNFVQPNQPTNVTVSFGQVQLQQGSQYKIIMTAMVNGSPLQFPVIANT